MASHQTVQAPKRRDRRDRRDQAPAARRFSTAQLLVAGTVLAVVVAGIAIGVSVAGSGSSSKPRSLTGARATAAMLGGIPQHGNVLGRPDAPVTLAEYGDLQCPICREYTLGTLPTIVRDYVRTGKVQLEFRGLAFVGSDSEKALRAVVAAGQQNREWNMIDLLYRNQRAENSGWVTDSLVRSAGIASGLDTDRLFSARNSSATEAAIHRAALQAQQDMGGQIRTPTFLVGRTGQQLQLLQISSLDVSQFTPALDRLLGR